MAGAITQMTEQRTIQLLEGGTATILPTKSVCIEKNGVALTIYGEDVWHLVLALKDTAATPVGTGPILSGESILFPSEELNEVKDCGSNPP